MSEPKELPRPPQTTLMGWVILLGSIFVALTSFENLSGIRSMAMRDSLVDAVEATGADLSYETMVAGMRALVVTGAVGSAAAAVLGFFVLRRDRGARVALSVLAVPLLISGLFTGGFVSMMVIAAIAMLWLQPSRNWFDGLPPVEPPAALSTQPKVFGDGRASDVPRLPEVRGEVSGDARPVQGFGTDRATPAVAPPAPGTRVAPGEAEIRTGADSWATPRADRALHVGPDGRAPRPAMLVAGAVVAIVMSTFGLLSGIATLVLSRNADSEFFDELLASTPGIADQGLDAAALTEMLTFASGLIVLMSLLAIGAAVLTLVGNRSGRVSLLMMSSFVLVFSIMGVTASPLMIVCAVSAAYVLWALTRPVVAAWFRQQ